jgi:hypothetical protein
MWLAIFNKGIQNANKETRKRPPLLVLYEQGKSILPYCGTIWLSYSKHVISVVHDCLKKELSQSIVQQQNVGQ